MTSNAPPRLIPLLEQFDCARERLADRMSGPTFDSGDGTRIDVPVMTELVGSDSA